MRSRNATKATTERRSIGYVRVSTEDQAREGVSLAAQEARIGSSGAGTVFRVTPAGKGKVLHRFGYGDGDQPLAALTRFNSTFYGTTSLGGASGNGTVFKITFAGNEKTLYSFADNPNDGSYSTSSLVVYKESLYGETNRGGGSSACGEGCGTLFRITPAGAETVLYAFQGTNDGAYPSVGMLRIRHLLYGTTEAGGASKAGTMFSLVP